MAQIEAQVFDIGSGFRLSTKAVPLPGLIAVLETLRTGGRDGFRYSTDNGVGFSAWRRASFNSYEDFGLFTDLYELVVDFVPNVDDQFVLEGEADGRIPRREQYDNSVYSWFFNQNDLGVMNWAFNVLEKLFDTGIIPTYISRSNSEDYSLIFFSITQFFGLLVYYGRQFRTLEENEMMLKNFIEGWNLVFTTIDTLAERQQVFENWIDEFYKRGTPAIAERGTVNGELLRLVGYDRPNEFLFSILRPQDMGWCVGYSSPTWRGTALLDQLSKDPTRGQDLFRNHLNYTVGSVQKASVGDRLVLRTIGTGLSGISFVNSPMECNSGLSYAIYVRFRVLSGGGQNIDFGVRCYDENMGEIVSRRMTNWEASSSFIDGEQYSGGVPLNNQEYTWKGIIFDVRHEMDPNLHLNFSGGVPLRFGGDCRYMAPYFVQNRPEPNPGDPATPQIEILDFKVRPLELKVSQGYLGQKNFVVLYAENNSMMTERGLLDFMKRYLLNFKNVVIMNLIDPGIVFLNFLIWDFSEGVPISGAIITLSNGYQLTTDAQGRATFELPKGLTVGYTVQAHSVTITGSVEMTSSKDIRINCEVPYSLIIDPDSVEISPDGGTATVVVRASRPWAFDTPIDFKETGMTITPTSGVAGDTTVTINIPVTVEE